MAEIHFWNILLRKQGQLNPQLAEEAFEVRKCLPTLLLAKPRKKYEAILKT
jgi:hypothetical protein